jgi:hypothetical protein
MAQELCSRCLRSFDEAELAAVGRELLCPQCQAAAVKAARRPEAAPAAPAAPAGAEPQAEPPAAAAAASAAEPEPGRGVVRRVYASALEWCRGRYWWARLPLLVFFAYMLVRHLQDYEYRSLFDAINLGIHELGHYAFRPFGSFMHVAGGTVLQCLAPLLSMIVFWRQRDYFAILLCFGWLSTNLFGVALYCRDALDQSLILVVPGEGAVLPGEMPSAHDWLVMLNRFGALSHAHAIGSALRAAATAAMLLFLVPGSFLVWRMWRTRGEKPPPEPES